MKDFDQNGLILWHSVNNFTHHMRLCVWQHPYVRAYKMLHSLLPCSQLTYWMNGSNFQVDELTDLSITLVKLYFGINLAEEESVCQWP